ncbi:phytanoyl-CoA dioxygenase family protein [Streptomyces triculaminicus]|uniref:Phytanoyl-CoA dioxygenase family protein n=1 Tax=Streptomyces triculaminicus TaxID=2816232 RepID=A0A939JTG8_9ACTN|nr:phytanoyl-CoA dioxygenase family protein [Streptomyces triculaminicus]MBO0655679.1 phytanoyl-CoA dioxygenase family protein [Streptomyces triculaminicus]
MNACLRVAAGSHRQGLASHEVDGFFAGKTTSLEGVGVDASTVVDCEGPAGSVVFLHPLVIHSSEKNLSDMYRRVFIPAYRAADAFPIYYGPHAAHNEPGAKLLRGAPAKTARSEGGEWRLPIAAAEFNSLYEIQEGSHVKGGRKSSTGYFAHEKK